MSLPLTHFLIVSGILFSLGVLCVIIRRNAVNVLMGIELIFNAANINLVAFSRYHGLPIPGQVFAIFIIMVAAAEVAVALAILLTIYRHYRSVDLDSIHELKW